MSHPLTARGAFRALVATAAILGAFAVTPALHASAAPLPSAPAAESAPAATGLPRAHGFPTIVLPTCRQMVSPEVFGTLLPTRMSVRETTRIATSDPLVAEWMRGSWYVRSCQWYRSDTKATVTVTVAMVTPKTPFRDLSDYWTSRGISFGYLGGPLPYIVVPRGASGWEMGIEVSPLVSISIVDSGYGSLGALGQDVVDNVVELNPWVFASARL